MLLSLQKVFKRFGGLQAVADLHLDVARGEVVGLIGPNGSGKTTLINVITQVVRADSGTIIFCGRRLNGLRPHQVARLGLTRTFQMLQLFNHLTVLENVLIGRHLTLRAGVFSSGLRLPAVVREEQAAVAAALETLDFFGLTGLRDVRAGDLSTGHARLVDLARAIGTNPRLMCLDEPASGLNSEEKELLMTALRRINQEKGIAMLLVEHDMKVVMDLCRRIVVLNEGALLAEGTPGEIRTNPAVISAYLGS